MSELIESNKTNKNISEDEIYEFNRNLSFPRRNDGSDGHRKAITFKRRRVTKNINLRKKTSFGKI
jgi:hypothetical protein